MMGRQDRDQRQLFYQFSLDEMIPADQLLRRINDRRCAFCRHRSKGADLRVGSKGEVVSHPTYVRYVGVVSTGRCNTLS